MQFVERDIPGHHRNAVDRFKLAVEEACKSVALIRTTVEVKSDGEQERVVFTLHDALGGATAVECAPSESPKNVALRAHQAAGKMVYGPPLVPRTRGKSPVAEEPRDR